MLVEYSGTEEVLKALADIGRTEDVQFSPDGTRLAIAGFAESRVLVLEVESMTFDRGWDIRFSRATTLKSASFNEPHGLAWADNEVLLVANRHGLIPVVRVPRLANAPELLVHPIQLLGAAEADFVSTPGSVALRTLGPDLFEVLICNNFAHTVSRHYLRQQGLSILAGETVIQKGLKVPDGVTYSRSGEWVAISNHYQNAVYIYCTEQLGSSDQPVGTLRGMGFPHGISFTPDDRAFFAADAGAPCAHMFVAKDADWTGNRIPTSSIRVMDDETFARGHVNPEEGGAKGLAVSPDGDLLCLTCEEQPLVFIDIREELPRAGATPRARVTAREVESDTVMATLFNTMERSRGELAAALAREKSAEQRIVAAQSEASDIARRLTDTELRAAHAEQRAAAAERSVAGDHQRLALIEARAVAAEATSADLRDRVGTLGDEVRGLAQRLRSAKRKATTAKAQLSQAKRRGRRVLGSASWRLTAPLRALRRLFSPRR